MRVNWIIGYIRSIPVRWKQIWPLAKNDFRSRYATSQLGLFWAFFRPIVMACVYIFVFSIIARAAPVGGVYPYSLWMLPGLIVWFVFSDSISSGVTTLTDGLRGGWHHGDGRWQGFIGDSCVYVIIDLGKQIDISSVSMDFMQNAGPDIYLPGVLVIECSNDGKHWQELHRQTSEKDLRRGLSFHTWQWNGKAKTRYLRILASSHDNRSWIFTDEVIVR